MVEVRGLKTAIRARFDGKVFVPEEPVDLPEGEEVWVLAIPQATTSHRLVNGRDNADAMTALERLVSRGIKGANLPDEALMRENIFEL